MTQPVDIPKTEAWIRREDIEVRGMAEGDVLLGAVVLYMERSGEVAFFVKEPGRGIGTRLLEEIEPVAARRGLARIWAWVSADNLVARKVFEKKGYRAVENRSKVYHGRNFSGTCYERLFSSSRSGEGRTRGKSRTIGILQPGYLPWLGFFEQLYRSDVFVLYDDVQYDKNGWRNRNRIKTAQGAAWLTVPVLTKGKSAQRVAETLIDPKERWYEKHAKTLQMNYAKAPFFRSYFPEIEKVLSHDWNLLVDLDEALIRMIAGFLGLEREIVRSSTLRIEGDTARRLIGLCKHFGADYFYEGEAGKDYIQPADFQREGIRVEFQKYQHPVYHQLHGEFISHLSVIDLIFNHGPESLDILTGKRSP